MTSPENWDINDLDDPIELDEEYSEHTTDETNADLLNLKKPDDNLYTPWQELIESAGQKISSDTIKSDEHDYVQCVGTFIAGVGHQNIIPLRQRANGLDALRRTGVSRTYFNSDLLQHLTTSSNSSNEQGGENNLFQISVQLPNTWANDNCENSLSGSGILDQLFKLVLPLSRKTDGYLRQNLLRTIKCT
nr:SJCHGC04701 protein [Schistosoma japonicum]